MNHATVCARLHRLMDDLEAARSRSPRDLWRAALDLEHVVLCDLLNDEEQDRVLADPGVAARLAACQSVFCALETTIERGMAAVVESLGGDRIWAPGAVGQHYIARYEELARQEVLLAEIRAEDRVLFIGSGPLPITAFEYHRQTGCRVDCVDFVPEAIESSRRIADRLGLADRVRSFQTRGELHDPAGYDVILVGVLALPKQTILNHLDAGAKAGCRILCRTTYGLRQLIYQRASHDPEQLGRLAPAARSVARGDRVISAELVVAGSP